MRVVFLGTPDFAVPTMEEIHRTHELVAAISQPDRARDRKGRLLPTPVRVAAERLGVPCHSFERIRDHVDELTALKPDVMVTAAFGQILTQAVLDVPKYGVLNVHASLLPKYRGSSPIQWAVINGETETGVTVMQTERGLDCGDILNVEKTAIGENETAGELYDRLKTLGARVLVKTLDELERGETRPVKQDESAATVCAKLSKENGRIDWTLPAERIRNLIRGLNPWPVAFASFRGETLKIYASDVRTCETAVCARNRSAEYEKIAQAAPGTVLWVGPDRMTVACGKDALDLLRVQLPGKRVMSVSEFAAGHRPAVGETLA